MVERARTSRSVSPTPEKDQKAGVSSHESCVLPGFLGELDAQTDPNATRGGQVSGQDPRQALLAALSKALESGDAVAARAAHAALGELLGDGSAGPVVDLATERRRRG